MKLDFKDEREVGGIREEDITTAFFLRWTNLLGRYSVSSLIMGRRIEHRQVMSQRLLRRMPTPTSDKAHRHLRGVSILIDTPLFPEDMCRSDMVPDTRPLNKRRKSRSAFMEVGYLD